ncbi:Flp pilus assembly protein TadG [Arthrobacter sp. CAN_A2]|uniref:TadE/TadG family type IV pilus assembly protein n=1 Tax=Arthrobacter sp. CAN_A2 TaxID=2787718 RepID=UPI0018F05059
MAVKPDQRGAIAVEFALVLPILLLLVFGIMEVGRAYNAQVTITNAARESVRVLAIGKNDLAAVSTARSTAEILNPDLTASDVMITRNPSGAVNTCPHGSTVTVTINYKMQTVTGIAAPFTLKGRGTMLCGG